MIVERDEIILEEKPITIHCPNCKQIIEVFKEKYRRSIYCTACGYSNSIPLNEL